MKKDFDVRPTASLRNVFRAAGFQDSELYDIYIKNGSLIIKPNISLRTAEKLAEEFIRSHTGYGYGIPSFFVNERQKTVTAIIWPDRRVGFAYCSKNDKFSASIGKALALSRALGPSPLPDALYDYLGI